MNSRIDIIGTNGNDGEHYQNQEWQKPMVAQYDCGHDFAVLAGDEKREVCHKAGCKGLFVRSRPSKTANGRKHDSEKPRMDLIPPLMELEVAKVLTAGAQKYSAENWRQVPELRRRYIAAAKRHINALQQGIARDEETGLHHAAHAVCCLMFLGEVELEAEE